MLEIKIVRVSEDSSLAIDEVIHCICTLNEKIRAFWAKPNGWAPEEVASLLSRSRLDRQVSLSHCLAIWNSEFSASQAEGALILAWVNLGALVEGSLKWFLSIYLHDYRRSERPITQHRQPIDPDGAGLEQLRKFFEHTIWLDAERDQWNNWLIHVRDRRNVVHAYQEREPARDISDVAEYHESVRSYLHLIRELDGRVPYPD